MPRVANSRPANDFDLHELLDAADFLKREGADVSEELRDFERRVLESLSDGTGGFHASISPTLLPEVGAEIFDTLLSGYLKWYRSRVIAVRMPAEEGRLSFAGYAQIERPWPVGLGIAYEMENAGREGDGAVNGLPRIAPVPGSIKMVIDAAVTVRAAIAAMRVEGSINQMLADPAGIVRKTLECRLKAAYGYRQPLGNIGLSIEKGVVSVAIYPASPA